MKKEKCPCGSKKYFDECCGLYISGKFIPKTPEALMRSRYSAYTRGDVDYIQKTMCGLASQGFNPDDAREWATRSQWLGLTVIATSMESATKGFVEFSAHYQLDGKDHQIHERSEFHCIDKRWYYVDGNHR